MRPITDPIKKQEILDAYLVYYKAYSERNWGEMLSSLASGFTMFGTGVDEACEDEQQAKDKLRREFFQAPSPVEYDVKCINIYEICKDVVLLMAIKDLYVTSQENEFCFRGNRSSIIMKMEGGNWKVAHGHWSQPDKDIAEGESVPYRLLIERSRELEKLVSERTKKVEEQKKELQNLNSTKDKLFSIIAHDLRNPFNSILGFSEMLYRNLENYNKEKMREMLDAIYTQSNVTYELLENLLNWARSQTDMISFSPREVKLKPVVNEITFHMEVMAGNKDIELNLDIDPDLKVYADRNLLQIILRNLIHNAIKFTPEGGIVLVSAGAGSDGVDVSVKDNGSGIEKEVIRKIQDGFTMETVAGTANEVGTGLGLMLCREFVEKHGGSLDIESEPGNGSRFSFTLPHMAG